ncbi:hypothetical protein MKW98_022166 [Papaver atlanticum]|uniref:Protein FAR1-RELATED SEQUENCE n=1 Tax=Papaver atlanticum TaxID=357466 RepID=A0AAD4TH04_9MAGN|nr:hypothetical protein MKW98_022166 [Papaver atlanticum]
MMNDSSKESDSNENVEDQCSLKSNKLKPPVVGMTFHRWGDMLKFYQEYASRVGFSIVKRSTRNNGYGILRGVTFACSEHLSKSRCKTIENGIVQSRCDAYITAKLEKCEHWRISVASLEHNHKCEPNKFSSKRCVHRHIESLERKIDLNIPADIATNVDPAVFEELWDWMVNEYDLGDNIWLKDIYEERRRWVPCYLTDTFWDGMSSTRINEAVKAFFDGYINASTTLQQFLEQYEFIRREKVEEEKEADAISSFTNSASLATTSTMEEQVRKCRHVVCVLGHNGVSELPDKYILRWWRRDVKRCHTKVKVVFSCWRNDDSTHQYYDLLGKSVELVDSVEGNDHLYRVISDWLDHMKLEVQQAIIEAKESANVM